MARQVKGEEARVHVVRRDEDRRTAVGRAHPGHQRLDGSRLLAPAREPGEDVPRDPVAEDRQPRERSGEEEDQLRGEAVPDQDAPRRPDAPVPSLRLREEQRDGHHERDQRRQRPARDDGFREGEEDEEEDSGRGCAEKPARLAPEALVAPGLDLPNPEEEKHEKRRPGSPGDSTEDREQRRDRVRAVDRAGPVSAGPEVSERVREHGPAVPRVPDDHRAHAHEEEPESGEQLEDERAAPRKPAPFEERVERNGGEKEDRGLLEKRPDAHEEPEDEPRAPRRTARVPAPDEA